VTIPVQRRHLYIVTNKVLYLQQLLPPAASRGFDYLFFRSLTKRTDWLPGSTVGLALLLHSSRGPGFDSRLWVTVLCGVFHVLLPVSAWVSSGRSGFLPQSPKNVRVRCILAVLNYPLRMHIGQRGISGVNMWGCGDRGLGGGLWSVQTRWAEWSPSAL